MARRATGVRRLFPVDAEPAARLFASGSDGPTLADVVEGAWDDLCERGAAACPVCGGTLTPRYGAGGGPVAGGCGGCGSSLA